MRRPGLVWIAIGVSTIAAAAVLFDRPATLDVAMSSDMLLTASLTRNWTTHIGGWRDHPLARVPSLVPDLAVSVPLLIATGSARWSAFVYGVAQLGAFVAIAGWLAALLARRSWVAGAATVSVLLAALILLLACGGGGGLMLAIALLPVIHFGPLVIALLCAGLAARGSLWAMFVGVALVFPSDRLLIAEFLVPLVAVCAGLGVAGRLAPSRLSRVALAVVAGWLVGSVGLSKLKHAGVRVDGVPETTYHWIRYSLHMFRLALPRVVAEHPVMAALIVAAALAWAWVGWRLIERARKPDGDQDATTTRLFVWGFGGVAVAADVVFTACFYLDEANLRYLSTLWAWSLIFVAAATLRVPRVARAPGPLAAAGAIAMLALWLGVDRGRVALLGWDRPEAACVRRLRGPLALHAGLAEYWVARPAEVALDWTTQIDQIASDGTARPWNNDPDVYRHALADPARPPEYDFIVMRSLRRDLVLARYGRPAVVAPCDDTEIWVWHDRSAFDAAFAATVPPL